MMRKIRLAAALLLALVCASSGARVKQRSLLSSREDSGMAGQTRSNPKRYVMDVTSGTAAPDCLQKRVILVNGQFQPLITFVQGDWVEVGSSV